MHLTSLRTSQLSLLFVLSTLFSGCGGLTQLKTSSNFEKTDDALKKSVVEPLPYLNLGDECEVSNERIDLAEAYEPPDLWDRIRDGYALKPSKNKRIQQQLNWYVKHPNYMERVAKRGERYMYHIVNEIERRDMPLEIALLPIVESAFDPFAYSHSRASGIWQIIPGTGKSLGLKQNWWYDGRRDIVASTDAALTYLQQLHKRFDGDWLLALAAYNSGGGNVSKAIKRNKKRNKPTDFWNLDLPKETEAYVPRLLALSQLVQSPEHYSLTLYSISNSPYFEAVHIGSQIDLAQAAELAELDMDVLYHLNPGFNRWATDPKGPHDLLVPFGKGEKFKLKLQAIPEDHKVTWDRYTIKSGDTLSTIARKYKISVASLKAINDMRSNLIRAGKTLIVPIATKNDHFYSHSQSQRLATRRAQAAKSESGQRMTYTVKKGDSLWSIAKRFGIRSTKIARWNNMALKDPIKPGQKLVLWSETPFLADSSGEKVMRKVKYRVRNGDSLARIASKFQLRIKDILRWNEIDASKYLQPGQSLTLFVNVKG